MTRIRHLVALDFEATCERGPSPDPQEVIEFPSVLVDLEARTVVDTFEAFVRPVHHPVLTAFCTELTSITQAEVDAAEPFPAVFEAHQRWLRGHGLQVEAGDPGEPFLFVTCGDWDLATLLPGQVAACVPPQTHLPRAYRSWLNLKRPFTAWKGGGQVRNGLMAMLEGVGLEPEGRHHRGIDDARNTARVALALAERGVRLAATASLSRSRYPPIRVVVCRGAEEFPLLLRRRTLTGLLDLASRTLRRPITAAWDESGGALDADRVLDLRDGQRLVVA